MLACPRIIDIRTATLIFSKGSTQLQSDSPSLKHGIFLRRQRQRKGSLTASLRSEEPTKKRRQKAHIDMQSEQQVYNAPMTENDMLRESQKSLAARACSQALDSLDKLSSNEQLFSQPLRHRSKALRALDLAGVHMHAI